MWSWRRFVSWYILVIVVIFWQRIVGVVVCVYFQVRCFVIFCKLLFVLCFYLFCVYFFIKFLYWKICSIVDNCFLLESMYVDIYNLYEMIYMFDGLGVNYLFLMYFVIQ